jgi:dsRNA-specific ribonuclease
LGLFAAEGKPSIVDRILEQIAGMYLDPGMHSKTLDNIIWEWWLPYLEEDIEPVLTALTRADEPTEIKMSPSSSVSSLEMLKMDTVSLVVPKEPPEDSRRWKSLLVEFALHSGYAMPQYTSVPLRVGDTHAHAVEVIVRDRQGNVLGYGAGYGSGANVNMAKLRASEQYVRQLRALGYQL